MKPILKTHIENKKNILRIIIIFIEYANFALFSMLSENQRNQLRGIIKKPHVNAACIGCSVCSAISGDVFYINDSGLSCVQPRVSYEGLDVDDAIAACPVSAISWQEAQAETGEYANGLKEHDML